MLGAKFAVYEIWKALHLTPIYNPDALISQRRIICETDPDAGLVIAFVDCPIQSRLPASVAADLMVIEHVFGGLFAHRPSKATCPKAMTQRVLVIRV